MNKFNDFLATVSWYSSALVPIALVAFLVKTMLFGIKVKTNKPTVMLAHKDNTPQQG